MSYPGKYPGSHQHQHNWLIESDTSEGRNNKRISEMGDKENYYVSCCLLPAISCLLPSFSYLLSPAPCLLPLASNPLSPSSCPCNLPLASYPLSPVSSPLPPSSCILSPISCPCNLPLARCLLSSTRDGLWEDLGVELANSLHISRLLREAGLGRARAAPAYFVYVARLAGRPRHCMSLHRLAVRNNKIRAGRR